MAVPALIGYFIWCTIVFLVRNRIHRQRTGSSGVMSASAPLYGKGADLAGFLWLAGFGLASSAPWLEYFGKLRPLWDTTTPIAKLAAALLFIVGLVGTFGCQLAMGNSWRIGLDVEHGTSLVVDGPFRFVRNPIYDFVFVSLLALIAAVPNILSIAAFAMIVTGIDLWVRRVEEPFLIAQHGDAYRAYAAKTGRFLPGIGRGTDA